MEFIKHLYLKHQIILASLLGNALEFYDFTLYAVFATTIAQNYFPHEEPTTALLTSLSAFAIGFLARPLGALTFGYMGDQQGRKKALTLSILLMGLPTFLIGIAPTYTEIGLTASFLVFGCRLLQGFFTGGEYNGAAIFSIEHLGKKYPGFIGGLITGSCVMGALIATLLGTFVQQNNMPSWAWRLPFLLGAIISIVGYFIRSCINETPEFTEAKKTSSLVKMPLFRVFKMYPYACFLSFITGGLNGALSYTLFGFLNIYLSRYMNISLDIALKLNILGLLSFMLGSPCMGYCFDKIGQQAFLASAVCMILLLMIPIFIMINTTSLFMIAIGQILLGLCTATIAGSGHAIMQNLFTVTDRYSGIGFNFSLGMALVGGITPMVYVSLIETYDYPLFFPAFFLMGLTFLFGLAFAYHFIKKPQLIST